MTIRLLALGLASGAALAQPPAIPVPASPEPVKPAANWTADITAGGKPVDGAAALPRAVADARAALAKLRDYSATMLRQERVNGTLLPEQTCRLGVRTQPPAVLVSVTAPKPYAGTTTSFVTGRGRDQVRHRAAGPDGTQPAKTLGKDDPAAMSGARHPVTGYGLAAVLDRVDGVLRAQKAYHRPTQVLVGDYTFNGKPVTRFEVFADRPSADSPRRLVLCFDAATRLPVRYEAYGAGTPDAPAGELLEVVSFLGTKANPGLGDAVFGW